MDSSNFKNFSCFFSLVLCTGIFMSLFAPIQDNFRTSFCQALDISYIYIYIYILSFTTVYFETTFSFILKQIACAGRMKLNDNE